MKINLYYFFTLILFFKSCPLVYGQSISEIKSIKNPLLQLEMILQLSVHLNGDTSLLKNKLAPVLELAEHHKSVPFKWAYYMLMADGYSIAFDQTNAISDQYYQKAHQLMEDNPDPELKMIGNIRQGYYNFTYRKVTNAFPYFLRANDLKSRIDIKKVPLVVKHYKFMSSFFNYIGDEEKAVSYLKEALPFSKPASRERVNLINSISVYLSTDKPNPEALKYLKQAMSEAKLAKDSVWIGIISGNMARYILETGDTTKAIALIKRNIDLSLRYNELHDAMRANLKLATLYTDLHEWSGAKQYIATSESLMEDKPYFLKYKMDAAKSNAEIAHGIGQQEEELQHLRRYTLLRDSLEKRTNVKEMQKIIWENEREKYTHAVQSETAKRQAIKRKYQFIGVLLILTFAIIVLLINRSKTKIKIRHAYLEKDQLALTHEKQLLDQELSMLKNSLNEFTDTIKKNDVTIQHLRDELAKEETHSADHIAEVTQNLNALLKTHIMTDERWITFKFVFDKVYPGYLQQMKDEYAKITENDLRILALQKLDLSNASMSELLCISIEGIKKAKQRLKKKLELKVTPNAG